MLARIAEERGNPQEAAEIMQEVAVETYGALSKEEKVAFILEQVRLVLDRGDYTRAQILAKKVNPRTFVEREKKATDKPVRDSTVAPPAEVSCCAHAASVSSCVLTSLLPAAQGTPSLGELKLQYYALMIRYNLVRWAAGTCSVCAHPGALRAASDALPPLDSTRTTTWRCAAATRPSTRRPRWRRMPRAGSRR
jgi:hypothetical protein